MTAEKKKTKRGYKGLRGYKLVFVLRDAGEATTLMFSTMRALKHYVRRHKVAERCLIPIEVNGVRV